MLIIECTIVFWIIFPLVILLMLLFATLYHVIFFCFCVEIVNLKKLQKSINEMKLKEKNMYHIYAFQNNKKVRMLYFIPDPNSNVQAWQAGRIRIPVFLGVLCLAVCLQKIFSRKTWKGSVLKLISRDIGYFFRSLPRIKKKGGEDLYVPVSWAFNSLPRKGDNMVYFCGRSP